MKGRLCLPVSSTQLEKALDGNQEGDAMILDSLGVHLVLVRPIMNNEIQEAFCRGVVRYTYWESSTPVPIPVWVFFFPPPLDAFDVVLSPHYLADEGILHNILHPSQEKSVLLHMVLAEKYAPKAELDLSLDPRAAALFRGTLKRWQRKPFGEEDYAESRATVRKFNASALARFGMSFRGPSTH